MVIVKKGNIVYMITERPFMISFQNSEVKGNILHLSLLVLPDRAWQSAKD